MQILIGSLFKILLNLHLSKSSSLVAREMKKMKVMEKNSHRGHARRNQMQDRATCPHG